ncbi:MAG: thioredoxin [Gammaproteobacteria bacterium SG8_47]|nr:MAG: thioredoxin [Gammaproteobacteria bacterium SG8_47]
MAENAFIVDTTTQNFASTVVEASHQVPVLVDFWASWCGPCQMLMPILTKLAADYDGAFVLAKVNIDEQQELASRFGVRSVPTVKLFRNGTVVDEFLGVIPEAQIKALLNRYIERESDRVAQHALQLIEAGKREEGLSMLRQALESDPDNERISLSWVETLLECGHLGEARQAFAELPHGVRTGEQGTRLGAVIEFAATASQSPAVDQLRARLPTDPDDSEARYALAAHCVVNAQYETALEELLELLSRDRSYGDDAARKGLLQVFELLGGRGELVSRYRSRMSAALH